MSYKDNETNKGKRWSTEEIDDLIKELNEKVSISDISTSHKEPKKQSNFKV